MKPLIIGVSGKKQSGKSSLCEYLKVWYALRATGLMYNTLQDIDGSIRLFGLDKEVDDKNAIEPSSVIADYLFDYVKVYNFADALKRVCIDVLGMTPSQCYGTDKEKNTPTSYLWENMPDEINLAYSNEKNQVAIGRILVEGEYLTELADVKLPRRGVMTGREVMQVVGTDIFRKMFSDMVWVNATFNYINQENKAIALIADCRFESEVKSILDHNGYIIRLNRVMDKTDQHPSETALDNYDFAALGDRCLVIENEKYDINQKNELASNWLDEIISE